MRRRAVTFGSRISLVLGAAALALWIGTYFGSLSYGRWFPRSTNAELCPRYCGFFTNGGVVGGFMVRYRVPLRGLTPADQQIAAKFRLSINRPQGRWRWGPPVNYRAPKPATFLQREGFGVANNQRHWGAIRESWSGVSLPCWFLVLLFAALPSGRAAVRLRRSLQPGRNVRLAAGRHRRASGFSPDAVNRNAAAGGLFTFASASSLLLCIAAIAAIATTLETARSVIFTTAKRTLVEVAIDDAHLSVATLQDWPQKQSMRYFARDSDGRLLYPYRDFANALVSTGILGVGQVKGTIQFGRNRDGTVMLLPYGMDPYYTAFTAGLAYRRVEFSLREIALAAAVLPVFWSIIQVRRRIRRQIALNLGLCLFCGYDLLGNVSGVCPECGKKTG